ncbi:hypothetical protein C5C31_08675 [Rathayibacter rathayi]|nr:hypothetical protein C5C02_09160 [Rathayibacter rathayi]PPG75581.1 hypothetical protein C5C23_09925 [Rathayibacter rathayi]PPH22408.1 hypothetical protein C5C31_08675 [Rathayibacter rathayi]PPI75522.1 hypothetical protein C5E03_13650 [Rathayibacter rathayi]
MHLNFVLEHELLLIRHLASSSPASRRELASTTGLEDARLLQTVEHLLRSGAISKVEQGTPRY